MYPGLASGNPKVNPSITIHFCLEKFKSLICNRIQMMCSIVIEWYWHLSSSRKLCLMRFWHVSIWDGFVMYILMFSFCFIIVLQRNLWRLWIRFMKVLQCLDMKCNKMLLSFLSLIIDEGWIVQNASRKRWKWFQMGLTNLRIL